jgi:Xaa-Pro aminopeptidase
MSLRPFTADDYRARMARAVTTAEEHGLAGLIVTPGPDLLYFCGYQPASVIERVTALLLTSHRPPTLLVPRLDRPGAEAAAGAVTRIVDWADNANPYSRLARLLPATGHYAVSDSAWAAHLLGLQDTLPNHKYSPLGTTLPMLRAVKEPGEVDRLAAAATAADATYQQVLTVLFAGHREVDIAADLALLLRRHGHSRVDLTIVGSGPNGAHPNHGAAERIISAGDVVVLDFAGLRDDYGSDTARTVYVGAPGKAAVEPPPEVRSVYELVHRAHQAAFEAARPGATCEQVDRAAREVIADGGYGGHFPHATGHGIGLTTREPPYLKAGETQPLLPGMCVAIEPGVYLPGRFGVRIEDIVVVTDAGARRLTTTPHDLATVS